MVRDMRNTWASIRVATESMNEALRSSARMQEQLMIWARDRRILALTLEKASGEPKRGMERLYLVLKDSVQQDEELLKLSQAQYDSMDRACQIMHEAFMKGVDEETSETIEKINKITSQIRQS